MISAACHVHSSWSYDGRLSLAELATEFSRKNYRVVLVTEHDKGFTEERRIEHRAACAAASTEKILLVPGIEYSDSQNRVHTLVWGNVRFAGEGVPTAELLKTVKSAGGASVFAHPDRLEAWRLFDPSWCPYLLGIELWNRKTDGWASSRSARTLLESTGLLPFVGMDFHTRRQLFPLSMDLEIERDVSEESVVACLLSCRCHAMAFGRPAARVLQGSAALGLDTAERCRRGLRKVYRLWKGSRRSKES